MGVRHGRASFRQRESSRRRQEWFAEPREENQQGNEAPIAFGECPIDTESNADNQENKKGIRHSRFLAFPLQAKQAPARRLLAPCGGVHPRRY